MAQKVKIKIRSLIDKMENVFETYGEYRLDGETHLVAYTDYSGNQITRNGIYAGQKSMLLHRTGAIAGEILFDPEADTRADYSAAMVSDVFRIHTDRYTVHQIEKGIGIILCYHLQPGEQDEISAMQEITITYCEPKRPQERNNGS